MRLSRLVLGAVVAALAATAPAASAAPICTGTEEDLVVCVNPEGVPQPVITGELISRCVYVPTAPDCRQVTVPFVALSDAEARLLSCDGGPCPALLPVCEEPPRGLLGTVCRV